MFVAQAHSFKQQARLAVTLAWIAGYTNILTILTCAHVTSHVSGTTSDLGRALIDADFSAGVFLAFLLTTFAFGAAISGFVTELGRRLGWESIYVLPMGLQTLLLGAFAILVEVHDASVIEVGSGLYLMTGLASIAMGIQNATVANISSGAVRTTHVTGVLTDLGAESAIFLWWLRDKRRELAKGGIPLIVERLREHPTARHLALLAAIVAGFALGAALGTLAYRNLPELSMLPPVLFLLALIYQDGMRPIGAIQPSEIVAEGGLNLPPGIGVFAIQKNTRQPGRVHHMPNLIAWADRLPPEMRVVILDMSSVEQLDADSAEEVHAALLRFTQVGRTLILAGITHRKYEQLRKADGSGGRWAVDPTSVCPDLEIAIARGFNHL